mgnify:FL=1
MNEKEVAEIRRRFNPQKTNISRIQGCYVNEEGKILTEFSQPLVTLLEEETQAVLTLLKKALSGTLDKNLINLEFPNAEIIGGQKHKNLLSLRDSALNDTEALHSLFENIVNSIGLHESYIIIAGFDTYDVFRYTEDGKREDDSEEQFGYFVCAVCPLKLTKPALSFTAYDNAFHSIAASSAISSPELGFMFPAFDDRAANIYGTLFYTKDSSIDRSETVNALFSAELPMPADSQKDNFDTILTRSLGDQCDIEMVKGVNSRISDMLTEHKEQKNPDTLTLSLDDISDILRSCDATNDKIEAFAAKYGEIFGEKTRLSARNIVDPRHFSVNMTDVSIRVNPEKSGLLSTGVIDGTRYILVRAEEAVEVNGITINIADDM